MILNSAPQDQAILSNVGQIGEFRIRNSAKAFNILSSGLYANKIKAIIRELSCNAVDSHVAAGKENTPFDVHLPTALEPHFSIRDYGTGLDHAQVTNIYTTYFESTKTDSNQFIGALGLGSKSPFSYTDNFTVTTIKNGRKGIYTAFINNEGVPSIALMMEEETTDPNGVEVKFSVTDRYDFDKFRQEARAVYTYFKLKPVVSSDRTFQIPEIEYKEKDIVPGVHTADIRRSVAIMGNIAYPIEVPNAESNLGELKFLLDCNLIMEFDIGELDFQASREGLSYIPTTIESIKKKLTALNKQLGVHITEEISKIDNKWEILYFLTKKHRETLWKAAVINYVNTSKFPLTDVTSYNFTKSFMLDTDELATKYNITIKGFTRKYSSQSMTNLKPEAKAKPAGNEFKWRIVPEADVNFVINDTKVGITERAKFHFRTRNTVGTVYALEKADKTKVMKTKEFFKLIENPPGKQIHLGSSLDKKETVRTMGRNVTILKLEERDRSRSYRYNNPKVVVWSDAGKADKFDINSIHYYLPLSGFTSLGKVQDIKSLYDHLYKTGIYTGEIYGVRKSDMAYILTQKNWVNLDTHITSILSKMGQTDVMGLVKQAIDVKGYFVHNVFSKISENSPYAKFYNIFKDVKETNESHKHSVEFLCKVYGVNNQQNIDPHALIVKYRSELNSLKARYPLLDGLGRYHALHVDAVSEYINLVDEKKGV